MESFDTTKVKIMAQWGDTQEDIRRLKAKIKEKEKEKSDLEKQISDLKKQLKDHNENCVLIISDLRRQIEKLERKNDELRQQITTMKTVIKDLKTEIKDYKESNDFLEESVKQQQTEITDLKKSKDCLDKRVKQLEKKFETSEDRLCIGQLLIDAEKNICEVVLEEFYDKHGDHNANCMDKHIKALIKDEENLIQNLPTRSKYEELKECKRILTTSNSLLMQAKFLEIAGIVQRQHGLLRSQVDQYT